MPLIGKSAVAIHDFSGDVRTHMVKIAPAPQGKANMFFKN